MTKAGEQMKLLFTRDNFFGEVIKNDLRPRVSGRTTHARSHVFTQSITKVCILHKKNICAIKRSQANLQKS